MNHPSILSPPGEPESAPPARAPVPASPIPAVPPAPPAPPAPAAEAGAPLAADPEDPSHALLKLPLHVRSATLVLLAAILLLGALKWASAFFIPLMLGYMMSYALSPIVDALQRARIPRAVSAGVLILALLGGAGASLWSFTDDVNQFIDSLPAATQRLGEALRKRTGRGAALDTVQRAAQQFEQATSAAGPATPPQRNVQRVVVERPRFDLREHLWSGTVGLASLVGQAMVVTFLTYFLLVSGDTFRRKLVKITEGGISNKKITVQALDEITQQIQRYLLVQLLASAVVGVATGLAFWGLGIHHAVVWGLFGGLLNLMPYIGSAIITGTGGLAAFMQTGELESALYVAGASLLIHTIVGNLLVPWLTSRASRMNPVAVFIGVLAWGWLWGVWGLLLGIPILMIVKAICDRVEHLKPVGELLGD